MGDRIFSLFNKKYVPIINAIAVDIVAPIIPKRGIRYIAKIMLITAMRIEDLFTNLTPSIPLEQKVQLYIP